MVVWQASHPVDDVVRSIVKPCPIVYDSICGLRTFNKCPCGDGLTIL